MDERLVCPNCGKKLEFLPMHSAIFGMDTYECIDCEEWGIYYNGKLDWNFSRTKKETEW